MRMRCQLLNNNLFYLLLCFGLLNLNGVAFAQVYKSYDADGNVIFSDKPTQGSKEVEITKPNLSESFELPPSSQPAPVPESESAAESEPVPALPPIADDDSADTDSADTNKDGRVSRREKEEQRKERRRKKREAEKAAEGNQE